MSEDTNNSPLSPDNSPTIMGGKKQARRLNSRPLYIGFAIVGILVLTLGLVMIERSNRAKAEVALPNVKSAAAQAKALTAGGEGGVINTPVPTLPLLPMVPEKLPVVTERKQIEPEVKQETETLLPPNLPEKQPVKPRLPEEVRMMRQKRFRQFEEAIDSPIKVQLQDMKRDKNSELAQLDQQIALLGQRSAETYADRLVAIKASAENSFTDADYTKRGDLSRMNQFSSSDRNWENPGKPEAPSTPYIIRTGSVIPATMITGINSDLPGQIVGQVAQDVYDSPTGRHLLIPQGTKLVGEYSSLVQYGQSRLFAVWQRAIFPDGKALDIGEMPGSSGAGYAGFRDRVNNHYARIFGSAVMMSAVLAGVEMTQDNDNDSNGNKQRMADALSESLGQVLGGAMAEMLSKNMSIAPTLEIRPGYGGEHSTASANLMSGDYAGSMMQKSTADDLLRVIKEQEDNLSQYQNQFERLKDSASSADGQQEAMQAGNQFLSLQVQLLTQIHTLLMAQNNMMAAVVQTDNNRQTRDQMGSALQMGESDVFKKEREGTGMSFGFTD